MLVLTRHPGGEVRISAVQPRNAQPLFPSTSLGGCPESSVEEGEEMGVLTRSESVLSCEVPSSHLDSSSKLKNSESVRVNRRIFSTYMRRQIRRAGAVIEEMDENHDSTVFFTATVPGSTAAAIRAFRDSTSYGINLFKASVAARLPAKLDFYCWELQKRGMLHLHYVVYAGDRASAELIASLMKGWWINVLDAICIRTGVDIYERSDGGTWKGMTEKVQCKAEIVKKSVSAYVSKYCSKNSVGNSNSQSTELYPVRWAGVSRPLVAMIRDRTQETRFYTSGIRASLRLLENLKADVESCCRWFVNYCHKVGLGVTWVGYFEEVELGPLWEKLMSGQIGAQSQQMSRVNALVSELLSWYKNWGLRLSNSQTAPLRLIAGSAQVNDLLWSTPLPPSLRARMHMVKRCTELLPLQSLSKCMAEEPWSLLRGMVWEFYQVEGCTEWDVKGNLTNVEAMDSLLAVVRAARLGRTTREMTGIPPQVLGLSIDSGSPQPMEPEYEQNGLFDDFK